MSAVSFSSSGVSSGRWRTVGTVLGLVVVGKGLSFLREAFVASELGASSPSDAYYLALAMPTVIYSLGAIPFSMWATARLAALRASDATGQAASFYTRVLTLVFGLGVVIGLVLAGSADVVVAVYAPGLEGSRLTHAVILTRIGALAIPALGIQAVSNGRLFANGRFLPVYVWQAIGGLVGLGVVAWFTPRYGAAAAVWAFVAAAWTSIIGPTILARPTATAASDRRDLVWIDDLGLTVVYRALVMQLYFQASLLFIYGFGSHLPVGEVSSALFGSKIQAAVYETLAVTTGVLVFPRIAHYLQALDHIAVRRTMMHALNWLLPATAALVVLLIARRVEIVSLIYERKAFDDRATRLVASALLGYAPGIVGLTLVEIFHRAMVLRGRLGGYLVVFGSALLFNWVGAHILVPQLGVLGLTLSSSVGVLTAATGLVIYASRRLESMNATQIGLLVIRTSAAAGLTFALLTVIHPSVIRASSFSGQITTVIGNGVLSVGILALAMLALGHRWRAVGAKD